MLDRTYTGKQKSTNVRNMHNGPIDESIHQKTGMNWDYVIQYKYINNLVIKYFYIRAPILLMTHA